MKYVFVLLAFAVLAGCNTSNDTKNSQDDENNKVTAANFNLLVSTRWCAANDPDRDGKIGTFLFAKDGQVEWVGYNTQTQTAYGREKMQWQLNGNFMQMGTEIQTTQGSEISFTGFGPDRHMYWHTAQKPQSQPTNDNNGPANSGSSVTQPSFDAVPCDLNI
jgi:hypothetical protein